MPYSNTPPMRDYMSDVKIMSVYTSDPFLSGRYGGKYVLVGQQTLVQEMWDPRNSMLEDLRRAKRPPGSIAVEFKPPEKIRSGVYDVSSIRTILVGVEDELIRSEDMLYASKEFADRFYFGNKKIIIRPVIPEFGMKKISLESLRLLR